MSGNHPSKKPTIVLTRPDTFNPAVLQHLSRFCELVENTRANRFFCDAIWVDPGEPVDPTGFYRLRYVLTNTTDTSHVGPLCRAYRIEPISLQGEDLSGVHSTADYTELLVRLALRPVERWEQPGGMVAGKRVVILGEHDGRTGRVATQLEERLSRLNARVTVVGRHDLYAFAPTADVLSLQLPALPEYDQVIDSIALSAMKRGAALVNTARGRLVSERAVLEALESRHLGRYHTDFPPVSHALREHERCEWTDHVGGFTREDLAYTQMLLARKFRHRLLSQRFREAFTRAARRAA